MRFVLKYELNIYREFMKNPTSLKITYWYGERDFVGLDEFKSDLSVNYVSVVQGRRGALGGGLYHLTIEIISAFTINEIIKFILQGMAYDLIKDGVKTFFLRPFIEVYNKFKDRNKRVDISELRIIFQDTTLIIYRIYEGSILGQLEKILIAVSKHYEYLTLKSGYRFNEFLTLNSNHHPFEIHVPIFEDPTPDPISRFRVLLDVDEPIRNPKADDHYRFWGVDYNFADLDLTRVYDVNKSIIIDKEFYRSDRYWRKWESKKNIK